MPPPDWYVESPPSPTLDGVLACTWERWSGEAGSIDVLPDGCLDVIWSNDGWLFIAGPDRGPVSHRVAAGTEMVGVRLRPGVAGTVLGLPASELTDQRVGLADVLGRPAVDLAERIASLPAERRAGMLEALVTDRLAYGGDVDGAVLHAVGLISRGGVRMSALADEVGLSDRQLLRRFGDQVGYAPKVFDRIVRFRRFLSASINLPLAGAAAIAGYADQAHLNRESRRLAGLTPAELVARMSKTAAGYPVTMAA